MPFPRIALGSELAPCDGEAPGVDDLPGASAVREPKRRMWEPVRKRSPILLRRSHCLSPLRRLHQPLRPPQAR